jgi:hypothetical protein
MCCVNFLVDSVFQVDILALSNDKKGFGGLAIEPPFDIDLKVVGPQRT